MRIQLPTETWIEILDWLKRRDMINKLDQLWDRQFTTIVQDWLHRYTRNVKIGTLAARANGLHLYLDDGVEKEVPIAQVEKPGNITSFEWFIISRQLHPVMLPFLHLMRPLFCNITLIIDNDHGKAEIPDQYQTTIRLLMPLISDQIGSLFLDHQCLQFLADNYPASVHLNVRFMSIWNYELGQSELLVNWLFTRREDGQPRLFLGKSNNWQAFDEFCTKVRERFLDPVRQAVACPFFVFWEDHASTPLVFENARTGEQLTLQGVEHGVKHLWVMTSFPTNTDGEWLAKKTMKWILRKNCNEQRIFLDFPVPFVGPLNANALTDWEQQLATERQLQWADEDHN